MRGEKRFTWPKKLIIGAAIVLIFVFALFALRARILYKPDLRYERDSYNMLNDWAVTSCTVKNYGRRRASRVRMSVEFLSKILDIQISPKSAGKIVEIAPDKLNAVLDLESIAAKGQVFILFCVEKPQDEPFDIHLLDISGKRTAKEGPDPIR